MADASPIQDTAAREYDLVSGGTITYTYDECWGLFGTQGGTFYLEGRNSRFLPRGSSFPLYLDTPLCGTCEGRLDHGVCHDCEVIYADVAPLGKGWNRVEL